jgi:hypothetical protein
MVERGQDGALYVVHLSRRGKVKSRELLAERPTERGA